MATENKKILHIVSDPALISNTQICVQSSSDADLAYKMWCGKDASGNVTQFLAKDKAAQVTAITLTGTAGTSGILQHDATGLISGDAELNKVSDVTIATPLDGQFLVYNSTSTKWENTTVAGLSGFNPGGVLYANSLGDAADQYLDFFWDDSNKRLGVNKTAPSYTLDVNGDCKLANGTNINEFSVDGTMAGNSDLAVPTEKAVVTYVTAAVSAEDFWQRAATTITTQNAGDTLQIDGGIVETSGTIEIGIADTNNGLIDLYGDGTGSTNGGLVRLHNPADHDGTVNFYYLRAKTGNLEIGPSADPDSFTYDVSGSWRYTSATTDIGMGGDFVPAARLEVRGSTADGSTDCLVCSDSAGVAGLSLSTDWAMSLGVDDTENGILNIFGDVSGDQGGTVYLYTSGTYGSPNYYRFWTFQDKLLIGPSNDSDSLKYDAGTWNFTAGAVDIGVTSSVQGTLNLYAASSAGVQLTHDDTDYHIQNTTGGKVTHHVNPVLLAAGGTFSLPTDSGGKGWFYLGGNTLGSTNWAYAEIVWSRDEDIVMFSSYNAIDASTGDSLCIYDGGAGAIVVKNNLASSATLIFEYSHSSNITAPAPV
jgi:hypothetical protein